MTKLTSPPCYICTGKLWSYIGHNKLKFTKMEPWLPNSLCKQYFELIIPLVATYHSLVLKVLKF